MFPLLWLNETVCSKSRMPHCDLLLRLRGKQIVLCLAVCTLKRRGERRQQEPEEGLEPQVAQYGNKDRPETSSPFASRREFLMDWQQKLSRRSCQKVRW